MKILKHIFVAVLIAIVSGVISFYLTPNNPFVITFLFLIISFFIFNLIVRKHPSYKNYFTSTYNIFTTKVHYQKTFDLPKELMFEKIIEVINNSNFKLVESNKETFEITAITAITFKSWGENLYIDFEDKEDATIMKFCSTTLFQMYSWGKNKENYDDLLNNIEKSLVI